MPHPGFLLIIQYMDGTRTVPEQAPAVLHQLSAFMNDGVAIASVDGAVVLWNRAMERITGKPAADVTGLFIWDALGTGRNSGSPVSRDLVMNMLQEHGAEPVKLRYIPGYTITLLCSSDNGAVFFYCLAVRERDADLPLPGETGNESLINSLRLSEEKYSKTFHLAPISLTITTLAEGRIVEVNDEFIRNTGFTREDIAGKTVLDVNIWETPEIREEIIEPVRRGHPVKGREIRFRHKNGDMHNYIFAAEAVNVNGIDCIISNFFDITDRKQLEEALRISEEKFSRSFRLAPISISITTLNDGRIVEVNDAFLIETGYTREGIVGRTVFDINIWEPSGARSRVLAPLREGKSVRKREILFRHYNGEIHNYIYSADPISLNGEDCIISIFFDITEKKKLEDALRISEAMYKTVFESTGSAMGIVRNDMLVLVNNGMVELSGYSREELEGKKTWQEFVIPGYVREIRKSAGELGAEEASLINRSEFKLRDRNGLIKDVYCLTALGPGESEYVVTLIDMTEYNRLLGRVHEVSRREQQRIGELLHDNLIQYLTGISLILRSLEMKSNAGRKVELRDLEKIQGLIGESLDLTKKLLKGVLLVEINYEGLQNALKNLAISVSELYDVSCTFDENCDIEGIEPASAAELYHIANEAVHNAVKHGNADSIAISLGKDDGRICLEVTDNGRGFGMDDPGKSDGLGLKLMRFRARMIGAKIRIGNDPHGNGVRVTCTLQKG